MASFLDAREDKNTRASFSLSYDHSNPIRKDGFLNKRGKVMFRWEKTRFHLQNGVLSYYKPHGGPPKTILLQSANVSLAPPAKYNRENCFELASPDNPRVYVLAGDTQSETQEWIRAIQEASVFSALPGRLNNQVSAPQAVPKSENDLLKLPNEFTDFTNGKTSMWRRPTSVRGILYPSHLSESEKLKLTELHECQQEFSLALVAHNVEDVVATGNLEGQESLVQISRFSPNHNEIQVEQRIAQQDGVVDLSWCDNLLLSSSISGSVFLYKYDPGSATRSRNFLAAEYVKKHSPGSYSYSGVWCQSQRIHCIDLNTVTKDCFLALENDRFHLWKIDKENDALCSTKASTSPLLAVEWSTHSAAEFMLAGVGRHLKILDTRKLTTDFDNALVMKCTDCHDDVIRSISWNPLIEYWLASAGDDGCAKIWDLRRFDRPMRVLQQHSNSVTKVCWSHAHAEVLMTGSIDRTMRIWNLRTQPHFVTAQETFSASVVGACFSQASPLLCFGLSGNGELRSVEMTESFLEPIVQHRFLEDEPAEQRLEKYLYLRDFSRAYKLAAEMGGHYWDEKQYEKAKKIVNMVSSSSFTQIAEQKKLDSFTRTVEDLAYYIPDCTFRSKFLSEFEEEERQDEDGKAISEIKVLKLRIGLLRMFGKHQYKAILRCIPKVCEQLKKDDRAFSIEMLQQILEEILPNDYLRALDVGYRFGSILKQLGRFAEFFPISQLLFNPTIYDSARSDFESPPDLMKKATLILERSLKNPKIVLNELELLYKLHATLGKGNSAEEITELMTDKQGALPAVCHKLHFESLLELQRLDTFFILCTALYNEIAGYQFAEELQELMDNAGFRQLKTFLDNCLTPREGSYDHLKLERGALTIVNITENSLVLPSCLENTLPNLLRDFSRALKNTFTELCHDKQYVSPDGLTGKFEVHRIAHRMLRQTEKLKETKRSKSQFFQPQLSEFCRTLKQFQISK